MEPLHNFQIYKIGDDDIRLQPALVLGGVGVAAAQHELGGGAAAARLQQIHQVRAAVVPRARRHPPHLRPGIRHEVCENIVHCFLPKTLQGLSKAQESVVLSSTIYACTDK